MTEFPRCHCGRAAQHENPPLCDEHLSERPLPPEFADVYEPPRVIVYCPQVRTYQRLDDEIQRIRCREFISEHLGRYRGMRLQSVGEGDAAMWCVSAFRYGGEWGSKDDGE